MKAVNKTTTHYPLMTKGSPGCQGIVDFDDPAKAERARKDRPVDDRREVTKARKHRSHLLM